MKYYHSSPLVTPLVSVIIPTYNAEKFIVQAIESVFAQTYRQYEILVIDDGSTDNTQEVLRVFEDRLHCYYQNNRGPSSARNKGIQFASGEYICFLDADDLWTSEKLQSQVEFMESHPELGLVFSDHEDFNQEECMSSTWLDVKKKALGLELETQIPLEEAFSKLVYENYISTPTVMVRKQCLEKVGGFDENLWSVEDRDLWLRIAAHFPIACLPRIFCQRRIHQMNISKVSELSMQGRITVLEKNRRSFNNLAPAKFWHQGLSDSYCRLGYIFLAQGHRRKALYAGMNSLVHAVALLLRTRSSGSYSWMLGLGLIPGAVLGWRVTRLLWQPIKGLSAETLGPSSKHVGDC